jgi:hypothetical protein
MPEMTETYELVRYPHQHMADKPITRLSRKHRKRDVVTVCKHCKNDTYSRDGVCAVCEILTPNRHLRMIRNGELIPAHDRLTTKTT